MGMRVVSIGSAPEFLFAFTDTNGTPTALSGGTVVVYEEGSTTEITSGVNLTPNYDGKTGLNQVVVTASAANGYEAGKAYVGVVTAGTVGGNSVANTPVFEFRVESVQERAARLAAETLHPNGIEITSTTTGNSTTAINLTDIVDAQTPDAALVGLVLIVWDETDGRIEIVETTACSSKVATVQRVGSGAAMSFTVAVGDRVIVVESAALRPDTAGRRASLSAAGRIGIDLDNTSGALAKGTEITGFNDLDAAGVRSAVGMSAANLDAQLSGIQADTDDIQARLPASLVGGRIRANTEVLSDTAAIATELAVFHGAYDVTLTGTPSATTFEVNVDVGADVRTGFIRLTSGALAGEGRPATHTGTTITVGSGAHTDMPAAWRQFSAAPASGVTARFFPL